ncbi:oxidoreductase [Clostridium butyricum]|uniref:FAD-dependent oxidoreductase n=1 Tax=Clostridium butyricum TaxID=1492 RepID=A0AAP9RC60_CLOBU|nr:FAD-dependent oxidoreductase [Clostridium butyricum]ALP91496.1 2,4-dienoyl-CoA reductase [Clostridium butyricum]ALS17992.1 2,4-dienoyl-CoA reductase [Clostridium butyricum]ANF15117.1 2,4-dienoyl-CoA reductase [Clostridium butyricum]AOR95127.1 2,4-dienoyl-CoA reductase [Clostridium butyricum]MBZ5747867.1 NAD(P)/FAD-dependent oxidoreductase [Clostridium butyricum]
MKRYNNIFTPLTVKTMTIKNRVVMPPMGSNFGGANGEITEEHISYYEQRAKGGTGLIILENVCVDFPLGSNGTTQLRLNHDCFIPGLYKFTERLHKYGTCVSVQINHSGASAVPGRIGMQAASASDVPSKTGGAVPRPLSKEEIYEIADKYADAARRAQMAGFDAVEIHMGHSYLISQFLSPIFNKRTDEFGGSAENRARFGRLVIEKVRAQVGPMFPIMIRISADELLEGGNKLEDTLEYLEYLDAEVDIYNVSAALNDSLYFQIDANYLEDGWRAYMSKAVRDKFNKPTITTGNIRNPQVAEDILAEGKADLVGMGRGLIAEPNWVNKVQSGKEETLRKCISCNIGCAGHRIGLNRPIRCTINPDVVFEDTLEGRKVNKHTNVVVIGGGTAGLEAACTAAEAGCMTFLFEKKSYLGGLAREIAKLPAKDRINDFPDYLINRVNNLKNLIIFTGTEATVEAVSNLKPDVIINATGSIPLLPPITGLLDRIDKEDSKVRSIFGLINEIENFKEMNVKGKKISVVGGGAVGLDVVEFFTEKGADVTIIERLPVIGKDLDVITKIQNMAMLKEKEVRAMTSTSLLEVKDSSFLVEVDGNNEDIDFDFGFVCLGMRGVATLLPELQEHFKDTDVEIMNIGDSVRARRIIEGTTEGRNLTIETLDRLGLFR